MNKLVLMAVLAALLVLTLVACAGAAAPTSPPVAAPTSGPLPTGVPQIVKETVVVAGTPQIVEKVVTATPQVTPEATAVPAPNVKNPDTIVYATIGEPESLDPAYIYETAGGEIAQNVYDTLVAFKKDSFTELVGLLASDWKVSDDGKTITFNMRKEPTFHSGNPVKASDAAYSFIRGMLQDRAAGPQWILLQPFFGLQTSVLLDPSVKPGDKTGGDVVNAQYNGSFEAACEALKQKIVADDNAGTLTMHLAQPYGPFLLTLANSWGSVLEKDAAVKLGDWDGDCKTAEKFHDPSAEKSPLFEKEIGSGPYKLLRWDHGNEIDLVANDNYWLKTPLWDGGPSGAPKVKNIAIKSVNEWGTRYSMLLAGDADLAYVPRSNLAQMQPILKEDCDYKTGACTTVNPNGFMRVFKDLPQPAMDALFFNWNVNTEGGNNALGSGKLDGNGITPNFFSNVHIRRAFNYCFDWDTYIKEFWQGEALQAYGPILQGYLGYDPNQPHFTYDIDKCKAEFEAASKDPGYEGLLDKGFFVQYLSNTGEKSRQTVGEILRDGLAKANPNFRLGLADEPWPVFLDDTNKGRAPLYVSGWYEDYHDPHDWVTPYLSSKGGFSGVQSWSADEYKKFDELIGKAVASTNPDERAKLYQQLQTLAHDDAVSVYLEQPAARHWEQSWLKGYYFNPIYPGFYYYVFSKG